MAAARVPCRRETVLVHGKVHVGGSRWSFRGSLRCSEISVNISPMSLTLPSTVSTLTLSLTLPRTSTCTSGSYRLRIFSSLETFRPPMIRSCACLIALGSNSRTPPIRLMIAAASPSVNSVCSRSFSNRSRCFRPGRRYRPTCHHLRAARARRAERQHRDSWPPLPADRTGSMASQLCQVPSQSLRTPQQPSFGSLRASHPRLVSPGRITHQCKDTQGRIIRAAPGGREDRRNPPLHDNHDRTDHIPVRPDNLTYQRHAALSLRFLCGTLPSRWTG